MKKKVLISGALPLPFTGPWVAVDDASAWRVLFPERARGCGRVEVIDKGATRIRQFDGDDILISGWRARAVIEKEIDGIEGLNITLKAVS